MNTTLTYYMYTCVIIAVNLPILEMSYCENELSDSSRICKTRSEMLNDESDRYSDEKGDLNYESSSENARRIFLRREKNHDLDEQLIHFLKIKEKQPPNWHSVQEVINRQIGSNPLFHRRFYGSLLAVERLSFSHKFTAVKGHEVTTLNFNQEGNLLANACADTSEIFIWDWAVSKKRCFTSGHTNTIWDVKWLPLNTERLVTCASDGVRLLNLNSNISEILAVYDGYRPRKLAVHPEMPNTVFSAGQKGKIVSIDVREKERIELLTVYREGTESKIDLFNIHFNPLDSNEFCVSGYCQYVRVYDRRQVQQPLCTLCPDHLRNQYKHHVLYCVYNHDGTEIVASYGPYEDVYLFDKKKIFINESTVMIDRRYVRKLQDARISMAKEAIFFGPKSEYVISGACCGYLFIWDKNTKTLVQQLKNNYKDIFYLKAHPFFPILATQMNDDIGIWMPCQKNFRIRNHSLLHQVENENGKNS
ncbi:DDB1- and CUL4-associated factor 8 isoform X2 [Solenopsis invicta]|uniref:DDB1- and CUL4-associated factor 8 isoform X2 n=1 Tax=Solenopsis invicta TaxID=13686 RepID=UPI00193D0CB0|nr:DDB1- and CUL4-associated factor 8 isoform X2 [Solenopsis invicta]